LTTETNWHEKKTAIYSENNTKHINNMSNKIWTIIMLNQLEFKGTLL